MKRFTMMMAMLGFLWVQPAHALLSGSYIDAVAKINEGTCAVSIKTSGSLLNILPNDKITLEGNILATLASLLQLNLGNIDHILAATQSFEDMVGVVADVELDPEACLDLIAGNQLQLLGPLNNVIDSLDLPAEFDDLTSLVIDANGHIDLENLLDSTVIVSNAEGDTGSVGGGSGGVGSDNGAGGTGGEDQGGDDSGIGGQGPAVGALPDAGGGCSLSPMMVGGTSGLWTWMISAAVLLSMRRRK